MAVTRVSRQLTMLLAVCRRFVGRCRGAGQVSGVRRLASSSGSGALGSGPIGDPLPAEGYLHLAQVALLELLLDVGQTPNVERRVGQDPMHHGQPEEGQEAVQEGHHEQVVVVGAALLESWRGSVGLGWVPAAATTTGSGCCGLDNRGRKRGEGSSCPEADRGVTCSGARSPWRR